MRLLPRLSRMAFYIGLVLVVTLSLLPKEAMPPIDTWDKVNHAAAYAALALAGGLGFRGLRALIVVAAGLLLLGAGLETVQSLLPYRMASFYDLLANVVGITLGAVLAAVSNSLWLRSGSSTG